MKKLRNIARWLELRHLYLPLHIFTPYYDRLDKKPSVIALLAGIFLSRGGLRHRVKTSYRRYRAVREKDIRLIEDGAAPELELLAVAAEKDFHCLSLCVDQALKTSINPMTRVTVIVPPESVGAAENLLSRLDLPVDVLAETGFISREEIGRLRRTFGSRYGWVLQQLVILRFVLKSQSRGVLVVDADTVLLERTLWLDSEGKQNLLVSSEFNPKYYAFLAKFGLSESVPKQTHVTHHMLMQPDITKTLLANSFGDAGVEGLIDEVLKYAEEGASSDISVDFEFYAQGAKRFFPKSMVCSAFGNRSMSSSLRLLLAENLTRNPGRIPYKSISFHSFND